jgi:hypothetical protein
MNADEKHTPSNIRACILGLCALLAHFNLPAQPIPSRYAFGLTLPQYVSMSASNTAQGYRPISLDANGPINAPNIAAVWINDGFTNWTTVLGVPVPEPGCPPLGTRLPDAMRGCIRRLP